jgi:site-specific recombinase XerD
MTTPNFATLLQNFFTRRLMQQKQVSPHTVASYRDTFRLLLRFAEQRLKKSPSRLSVDEIDAPFIGTFLHELEKTRGVVARSRNLRRTAIRSFFHFAAFEAPDHSAMIQRVLAIFGKRYTRKQVHFLTRAEATALLAVPDQETWSGRRDHALLLVALQTGLRVSELTSLQYQDVVFGTGAHVRVTGKGRKEREQLFSVGAVAEGSFQDRQRQNGRRYTAMPPIGIVSLPPLHYSPSAGMYVWLRGLRRNRHATPLVFVNLRTFVKPADSANCQHIVFRLPGFRGFSSRPGFAATRYTPVHEAISAPFVSFPVRARAG